MFEFITEELLLYLMPISMFITAFMMLYLNYLDYKQEKEQKREEERRKKFEQVRKAWEDIS